MKDVKGEQNSSLHLICFCINVCYFSPPGQLLYALPYATSSLHTFPFPAFLCGLSPCHFSHRHLVCTLFALAPSSMWQLVYGCWLWCPPSTLHLLPHLQLLAPSILCVPSHLQTLYPPTTLNVKQLPFTHLVFESFMGFEPTITKPPANTHPCTLSPETKALTTTLLQEQTTYCCL